MKKVLLSLSVFFAISVGAQDCSDLFISEYVESIYNNNAIEIYNPTSATIDLSAYTIKRYSGSAGGVNPEIWQLSGSIASGDVFVVGNGQVDCVWVDNSYWSLPVDSIFYSKLDDHCNGDYDANSTFYFNGDDAMTLEKGNNIIDIFGKVGEDPGLGWTCDTSAGFFDANGGAWWTKRKTLVRKPSVKKGITTNPILFNPTAEYDSLPDQTYTEIGTHSCDCITASLINNTEITYVMYPNPANLGNIVTINTKAKIDRIDVVNILGEKVQTQISNKIVTSNLAKGTYFINIKFADGRIVDDKLIIE